MNRFKDHFAFGTGESFEPRVRPLRTFRTRVPRLFINFYIISLSKVERTLNILLYGSSV